MLSEFFRNFDFLGVFFKFQIFEIFFSLYSANINLQKKDRERRSKNRGRSVRLLLYTSTDSGSLGGQPGSYCIPQPTLVCWVVSQVPIVYPNQLWFVVWSARILLYTPTDPGLLGGQIGSYCIPNQRWFVGWSARLLLYTPTDPGSLGGQPGS